MFAVVKTGGKQYRVTENQIVLVEKILGEAGDTHTFEDVLMLEDGKDISIGLPVVSGAKVLASIVEQTRGDKVIIFKKKRRHTYRRKKGHRQELTVLRIEQIAKPGDALKTVANAASKVSTKPDTKVETTPKAEKPAAVKVTKPTAAAKAPAKKGEAKAEKTEAKTEKAAKKPAAKKTTKE